MLAKLNEVLQVDLGTDERTYTDKRCSVRTADSRVRDSVKRRCRTSSREQSSRRGHHQLSELVNAQTLTRYAAVRAAIDAFLAVRREWGPDHSGPAPMDVETMTRKGKGKGGKSNGKGKGCKGKDTEKEKGVRFEGYCGHTGK